MQVKPNIQDLSYYAQRPNGLAESEKKIIATISRMLMGIDLLVMRSGGERNMCLIERASVEYDSRYWSSGSDDDDDDDADNLVEYKYYYMASNDFPGRNNIQ